MVFVMPFVRHGLGGNLLPQQLAGAPVETQHDKLVEVRGSLDAEGIAPGRFGDLGRRLFLFAVSFNRGRDEDAVVPHDGRRFALAG